MSTSEREIYRDAREPCMARVAGPLHEPWSCVSCDMERQRGTSEPMVHGLSRCPLGGHPPGECPRCDFNYADTERERAAAHAREWWLTYRAALTGLWANPGGFGKRPHDIATSAADSAHGPLHKDAASAASKEEPTS